MNQEPIATPSEIPKETSEDQRTFKWLLFSGWFVNICGVCLRKAFEGSDLIGETAIFFQILAIPFSLFSSILSLYNLYRLFFTDFLIDCKYILCGLRIPRWVLKIVYLGMFIGAIRFAITIFTIRSENIPAFIKYLSLY